MRENFKKLLILAEKHGKIVHTGDYNNHILVSNEKFSFKIYRDSVLVIDNLNDRTEVNLDLINEEIIMASAVRSELEEKRLQEILEGQK